MDQNQLNNLYYNIGWGDTNGIGYDGGGRVNFTDMGVSGLSKVRLSSDQLINRGKTLADKNQGARYAGQVKDYRNALTKAKADKASGNNPNYNWDEYIKSLNKNLSTYSKMASGYNKYLSGMDRLNAGETIERQGPQEGYTFDKYQGWIAPPKAPQSETQIESQPETQEETTTQNTGGSTYQSGSVFGGRQTMPSYWRKRVARQRNVKF